MKRAINEAKKCTKDVPVGAIIVQNNEIIATAFNQKEILQDVTAHAEILAIKQAQQKLNSFRLKDCELYVTLEPCPMCAWAILQSGLSTIYFGSYNQQYGAFGTVIDLPKIANSKIKIYGGILEEECDKLLKEFFNEIRNQ